MFFAHVTFIPTPPLQYLSRLLISEVVNLFFLSRRPKETRRLLSVSFFLHVDSEVRAADMVFFSNVYYLARAYLNMYRLYYIFSPVFKTAPYRSCCLHIFTYIYAIFTKPNTLYCGEGGGVHVMNKLWRLNDK